MQSLQMEEEYGKYRERNGTMFENSLRKQARIEINRMAIAIDAKEG